MEEYFWVLFQLSIMYDTLVQQEQEIIVHHLAKVEYIEVCSTSCEVIQFCKSLAELGDMELEPTVVYCDNQSYIKLSKNFYQELKLSLALV